MSLILLPGGFILPFEWLLGILIAFIVFFAIIIILLYLVLRGKDQGPEEEDILALVPVDEHDTIQRGKLVGNVQRSEDKLFFENPAWIDEEGNEYQGEADIEKKIPFPLSDASGREKRLWIGRDKGQIDIVSASIIVSEKIPKRWDLPLIDPRRVFRHLEGPRSGSSLTNALTTKTGIITVLGIWALGALFAFFIITAGGHLR